MKRLYVLKPGHMIIDRNVNPDHHRFQGPHKHVKLRVPDEVGFLAGRTLSLRNFMGLPKNGHRLRLPEIGRLVGPVIYKEGYPGIAPEVFELSGRTGRRKEALRQIRGCDECYKTAVGMAPPICCEYRQRLGLQKRVNG